MIGTTTTAWMWWVLWGCVISACAGMAFSIRQARRSATRLRLLLTGPSGSGKTWGALVIAKGVGGKTVVIDTEEGSSDLYDHLHDFGVIDLRPPYTPERYIEAIKAAEQGGADVIIVDSITHEWSGKGGCLELVDEIARARYRGNTWSAYSEVTPRHRAFLDAMLSCSAHVIATARAKTETAQEESNGKKRVVKLGMSPETRQGAEFEFTTVLDLVHDGHFATTSKDRTGLFAGTDPKRLTEETGRRLAEWLAGGVAVAPQEKPRSRWLERVEAAQTPEALDALWEDARAAAQRNELQASQFNRLSTAIAARKAQIEVNEAKGVQG